MRRWSRRGRAGASIALTVVAAIALLLGGFTLYLRQEVFDDHAFVDRAQSALQRSAIRQAISDELVDTAIRKGSTELLQAKPLLQTITDATLRTPAFGSVFRTAALQLHRLAFRRDGSSIALDLADVGQVVAGAARAIAPQVAKRIPRDLDARLIDFRKRQWATKTLQAADKVRVLGIVLPIVALLLMAGAIAVAPNRRGAVTRAGVSVAVVAAIGFAALLLTSATASTSPASEATTRVHPGGSRAVRRVLRRPEHVVPVGGRRRAGPRGRGDVGPSARRGRQPARGAHARSCCARRRRAPAAWGAAWRSWR